LENKLPHHTFTSTITHPTMSKTEIMEIYDKYFKDVFCLVNVLIEEPDTSVSITAEAFIALYRMKEPVIGDNNIKCFLNVTARNMSINYLKHHEYQRKP